MKRFQMIRIHATKSLILVQSEYFSSTKRHESILNTSNMELFSQREVTGLQCVAICCF